jgi:hypothetical protein
VGRSFPPQKEEPKIHKPIYEDRFEYDKRGNLILITNARGRGYDTNRKLTLECQFDCLKTYENGDQFCRNLYFNYLSGYYVEYPQEYYSYFNYSAQKKPRGYERYAKALQNIKLDSFGFNDHDAEIIYRKYPNFKYVVNKWKGLHSKREMLDILRVWKEHPEIELPLSLGYVKVCFTKSFFTAKKDKLKQLYKFMFNNQGKDYGITDLNYILKHGLETFENVKRISRIMGHKVSAEMADWADGILAGGYEQYHFGSDYHDYLEKAEYIGKDINDPYWKYPKDFAKRAEMVKEQYANKKRMEDAQRAEKQLKDYLKRIGKFAGMKKRIGRYNLFVPTTTQEWLTQAEKLHQCIIRMNYMDKLNENYILVFIYKDGEPLATCEITDVMDKKIGQFYADEHDRENCYPDERTKELMYNWLDELQAA